MKTVPTTLLAILAFILSPPAFAGTKAFSGGGLKVTGTTFLIVGGTCYYNGAITLGKASNPAGVPSDAATGYTKGSIGTHSGTSFTVEIVYRWTENDGISETPSGHGGASLSIPLSEAGPSKFINVEQINKSLVVTYTFVFDNTPPTLTLGKQPTTNLAATGWYNALSTKTDPVKVALSLAPITDSQSGVAARAVTIADADAVIKYRAPTSLMDSGGTVSYLFPLDGIYTLNAQASDALGNSASVSYTYRVDLSPPQYRSGELKGTVAGDGKSRYTLLRLVWPQADEPANAGKQSGIAGYYVEVNGTVVAGSGPLGPLLSPSAVSFDLPLAGYDRAVPHRLSVTVHALDVAGNETSKSTQYELPPAVSAGTALAALVSPEAGPLSQTKVTLGLQITPADFLQYGSVTFLRSGSSLAAESGLDGSVFTVIPSSVVGFGGQVTGAGWSVGSDGNLQYEETLPALFGMGGRPLSYTVTSETLTGASNSEPGGPPRTLTLPAHPGRMTVEILDLAGGAAADADGAGSSPALLVDATGRVQVRFTGTGIDGDDWTVGVHELIPQKSGAITIVQDVQLGGSENANRRYVYDAATFDAASSQYPSAVVPVTLSLGHNSLQVQWVQGRDPDHRLHASRFFDLDYEAALGGRYTLSVTTRDSPAVRQDGGAIVLAPGQPVSFHLAADGNWTDLTTVAWDFGGETAKGPDVSHVYHQVPNQGADSVSRTVIVRNLPDSPDAVLAVIVRDTQDGALYESETWNGPHTITGNVLVPPACTLSVGSSGAEADVTFAGGLSSSVSQGLTVQGTFLAGLSGGPGSGASGSRVIFAADTANTSVTGQPWGTILVKGSAVMTDVTVSGGDRGVTLAGALARLDRVLLTGNAVGFHAISGDAILAGCSITGNAAYGVKEDGGRPVMTGSLIAENGVDYYQTGVGGLTLGELNALNGNSGNSGVAP